MAKSELAGATLQVEWGGVSVTVSTINRVSRVPWASADSPRGWTGRGGGRASHGAAATGLEAGGKGGAREDRDGKRDRRYRLDCNHSRLDSCRVQGCEEERSSRSPPPPTHRPRVQAHLTPRVRLQRLLYLILHHSSKRLATHYSPLSLSSRGQVDPAFASARKSPLSLSDSATFISLSRAQRVSSASSH